MNLHATLGHAVRGHGLDAEVDGSNSEALVPQGRNDVRVRGAHLGAQVSTFHVRRRQHSLEKRARVRLDRRDAYAHGPALAQVSGQRPSVDAADAYDPLCRELVLERTTTSPGRRQPCRIAYDVAAHPDPGRL